MTRTPDQIVAAEVHYCVSYLVSTLAAGAGDRSHSRELSDVLEQAIELCSPIDDYEEAATQEGFGVGPHPNGGFGWYCADNEGVTGPHATAAQFDNEADAWRDACENGEARDGRVGFDPYQREVFEHWIVSDWLADQLEARGEKVDKDFAGMIVWARTTSGQGIASDSVIEAIAAEMNAAYPG